jgi:hypothetical protein
MCNMPQERHNSATKFHFQHLKCISILLLKVWRTLNSVFNCTESLNALCWSKWCVACCDVQSYLWSPHMISVRDMWCGLYSVYEFPDSICCQLSLSTKAATVFILFDSKVFWKRPHSILKYKLHYHFSTNHKQTHAPTSWLTAATPTPTLRFQTYIIKQTYTCHLPYERPTLCWMHHLKRKEYQVSNLLKIKHNQCFKSFMQ